MMRVLALTLCLMLAACANQGGGVNKSGGSQHAYEQAEQNFKQGQIMQARKNLLSIGKNHADYDKAQAFLNKTVEPSRQRLIQYHRDKADKAERSRQWFVAWQQYQQAAELSESERDTGKMKKMQLQLRSVRAQELNQQRQREDQQFLAWQDAYKPGSEVDANDHAFHTFQQLLQQEIDERVSKTLELAKKIEKDAPELAYVLLLSAERLRPDDVDDARIAQVKAAVPDQVNVDTADSNPRSGRKTGIAKAEPPVDLKQAQKLVDQQQWLDAVGLLPALRNAGSEGKALARTIEQGAKSSAVQWYEKGRQAFSSEQIDDAVSAWKKAVALDGGNEEYSASLQRALQLQERLQLIRQQQ